MIPRERFVAALHRRPVDRPPLAHVAALTTVEIQQHTGCELPDVYHDAEKQATLMGANHDLLNFDAVTFLLNYFNEPPALGADVDWGDSVQLPRVVSHPWASASDIRIPDDLLSREPLRTNLETLEIAKKRYGDHIAVLGKIMGPFSLVQMMHGVEATLLDLYDRTDDLHHLLEAATNVVLMFGEAQFDLGIDALAIGEGGAGAQMLSPTMYRELLFPWHDMLLQELSGPAVLHICGDITPRIDSLRSLPLACFNFDWAIAPDQMISAAGDRMSVMGNVSTSALLTGPPEEIERQVRENLGAGVHIISPGCAISPRCPNAHLLSLSRAIDRWVEASR